MKKVFVLTETEDAARDLCAGARTVAEEVCLVSIGVDPVSNISDIAYLIEVEQGRCIDDAYETVIDLCKDKTPDALFVEPTFRLRSIVGRVAARFGISAITGVISLDGDEATNLFYGGVAHRKQKVLGEMAIYTLANGVFGDVQPSGSDAVEHVSWVEPKAASKLIETKERPKASVDLTKSEVIVAAGRGFAAKEELALADEFCSKIHGDLGCTRPLTEGVDWLPRETYIGVSGLMLSPKTYVGLGVSGQMQHMVGINAAKTIFAINKDENAPIFKQADYGLVGEITKVLPEINALL